MDQNQTVDNDLQKAIDDITQTTNIDPVFSDPVAAPSSVPEGDTGELGEPVGPFPEPQVNLQTAPVTPEMAPLAELNVSEQITAPVEPAPMAPVSAPIAPTPELAAPAPEPVAPTPSPIISPENQIGNISNLNVHQIKESALRDLVPLLDRLNMNASQKFNLYRNIFEDLKDYTVLEPAYRAASEITNDTERAEALLYLVESIDKM